MPDFWPLIQLSMKPLLLLALWVAGVGFVYYLRYQWKKATL